MEKTIILNEISSVEDNTRVMGVEGLTKRDIDKINAIGYSTTFMSSDGFDLPYIGKSINMFVSYSDENDLYNPNTTYFNLDIGKNLDLIYIKKETGNYLDNAKKCLDVFLEWLNNN